MPLQPDDAPRVRPIQEIINDLDSFNAPIVKEAQLALQKFNAMLLPMYMMLCERAMIGESPPDEAYMFTYMGCGSSDYSSVGQFRELMGDERKAMEEAEKDPRLVAIKDEPDAD